MAKTYPVRLTGGQLRVLHEHLSLIANDPGWQETTATTDRDIATLNRATEAIAEAWRDAKRAESTPASGV